MPFALFPKIKLLLVVIGLSALGLFLSSLNNKTYFDQFFFGAQNKTPATNIANQTIQNYLQAETGKLPGNYGVYIKDLKKQTVYSVNPNQPFLTASIYKLAVMYKIFDMLKNNRLSYSDKISTGATVNDALNLMITVSENDSALALADTAGWNNIQSHLESTGVDGFNLTQETPTVNASGVATLLEKIYQNLAVSKEASQNMMDLLLAQQVNDRIPKYLPENVKVAHKTGELDNLRHDAGIVYGKNSTYIFVFLSETPAPQDAVENIAQLSKKMYAELEKP